MQNNEERLVLIPEEFRKVPCLQPKGDLLAFGLDNNGLIFLDHPLRLLSLGSNFLGYCKYDSDNHTINIPENVDTALGYGKNYYFSIKRHPKKDFLYIHKKEESKMQKLSDIITHLRKNLDVLSILIDEDNWWLISSLGCF